MKVYNGSTRNADEECPMRQIAEEKAAVSLSGWLALPLWFALLIWTVWPFIGLVAWSALGVALPFPTQVSLMRILAIPLLAFLGKGFGILQPNIAGIFTFFGRYAGTLRRDGFYWVNPFFQRQKMSLRANNLNTPTLKVNDRAGNPVEVAAVVVWRVADTARAAFDVEDYGTYIVIQSESAVRSVVSARWYDGDADGRNSLRGDMDAVAELLATRIQEHVALAGLEVVEARISHLAYAPEIASAMLRRQQAEAVVAARARIVDGAVGMVKLGIEQLEAEGVVQLSSEDRVRLVTNLMTVLVSESETHPVLSVGRE
jgi:regulator of protease activity HflC (stomatin/prohibitin superfamily)